MEDANTVFLKGAKGGLKATDELYDRMIAEDCKAGDHSNALEICYEMEAAGRMATTFHFNCLLSVQASLLFFLLTKLNVSSVFLYCLAFPYLLLGVNLLVLMLLFVHGLNFELIVCMVCTVFETQCCLEPSWCLAKLSFHKSIMISLTFCLEF